MRAFLTLSPIWAEARQVEFAEGSAVVGFRTDRAEGAETSFVVRARAEFGGGIDMQVEAFIAVGAVEGACVLVTFGHTTSGRYNMSERI